MRKEVDVSIVILNYNSSSYIKDCLDSIKRSRLDDVKIEVIVVDNASVDDSLVMLRKNFSDIKLIASKVNKGFAGGNNLA